MSRATPLMQAFRNLSQPQCFLRTTPVRVRNFSSNTHSRNALYRLRRQATSNFPTHLHRPISTETKVWIRKQGKTVLKTTVYFWIFIGLASVVSFGIKQEIVERKYPTPSEWSFKSRMEMRATNSLEFDEQGIVNWIVIGYRKLGIIRRLEDPTIDGKGLREREDGGILVSGVGKTGFDITAKSLEWREGYYNCLMATAKAAENVDGWVKDEERDAYFPAIYMVGPSNPNPKPIPVKGVLPPREEFAQPAFEAPDGFYLKVLTTKGFTNGQKIAAAIAYGDWFAYKKLPESSEEMYRWALDIALEDVQEPERMVKKSTGIIVENATSVTPNVLKATTALATHYASTGDLASSLPVFLSVLRASQNAPLSTVPIAKESNKQYSAMDILSPAPKMEIKSSGDDTYFRTESSTCDDARIMNNIGELLFASAKTEAQQMIGLRWTKDAVDLAEKTKQDQADKLSEATRRKCVKCTDVGLSNWIAMLQTLDEQDNVTKSSTVKQTAKSSWLGNLWGGSQSDVEDTQTDQAHADSVARLPQEMRQKPRKELGKWAKEAQEVERRQGVLRRKELMDHFMSLKKPDQGTWVG